MCSEIWPRTCAINPKINNPSFHVQENRSEYHFLGPGHTLSQSEVGAGTWGQELQ